MKLSNHEVEEGWRLAMETLDPVERVLRVRCAIKLGLFSTTNSVHMTAIASCSPVMKFSKSYSLSLPTKDSDAALDQMERAKVTIDRFVQACIDGKKAWPYESPIGIMPNLPFQLSSREASLGWEIAASVPDPVERAARVRCGVRCDYASAPGGSIVIEHISHLLKAAFIKPNKSFRGMAERIEAFVESCRSGVKSWPYDSPIGVMPDWSQDVAVDIVMKS